MRTITGPYRPPGGAASTVPKSTCPVGWARDMPRWLAGPDAPQPWTAWPSCTEPICTHSLSPLAESAWRLSCQSETLLSPVLTARMPPVSDHETFHTVEEKGGSAVLDHCEDAASRDQMRTRWSWEQLATTDAGDEAMGAQATSRTQSVCSASVASSDQPCVLGSCFHTLTRLSHPPVTSCADVGSCALPAAEVTIAPGS
mmetsp:Transcript_5682/g.16909  ORF Transcript_5682/g.16909 Transcript_5682/m.16909 type:complete len:200 (+) Transcript_5682:319-918(+)